MKLELRKVKVHTDMGEETECYSAEVFIGGRKVGYVSNDGHGGCDRLAPWSLKETLDAYAKTLPKRSWPESMGGGEYAPSWETVLSDAFDRAVARKEFDRRIKACVLFLGADGKVRFTKRYAGEAFANAIAHWRATLTGPRAGEKLLNDMPVEEAFEAYYLATTPAARPALAAAAAGGAS